MNNIFYTVKKFIHKILRNNEILYVNFFKE